MSYFSVIFCSNERMSGCNHLFAVVKNVIHERIYSGDGVDTLRDFGGTEDGNQWKQPTMIQNTADYREKMEI